MGLASTISRQLTISGIEPNSLTFLEELAMTLREMNATLTCLEKARLSAIIESTRETTSEGTLHGTS